MPQLSLYIDEETVKKIEYMAHSRHVSLSKWVRSVIKKALEENDWPEDYFNLFGSIKDESFKKPGSLSFRHDAKRENI